MAEGVSDADNGSLVGEGLFSRVVQIFRSHVGVREEVSEGSETVPSVYTGVPHPETNRTAVAITAARGNNLWTRGMTELYTRTLC